MYITNGLPVLILVFHLKFIQGKYTNAHLHLLFHTLFAWISPDFSLFHSITNTLSENIIKQNSIALLLAQCINIIFFSLLRGIISCNTNEKEQNSLVLQPNTIRQSHTTSSQPSALWEKIMVAGFMCGFVSVAVCPGSVYSVPIVIQHPDDRAIRNSTFGPQHTFFSVCLFLWVRLSGRVIHSQFDAITGNNSHTIACRLK